MFLAVWNLQQTEQRLKSLTVIHFSNPFQTNVRVGDIHFPGVRNCELPSGGNRIYGMTGQTADGEKAEQGVRDGIQQLLPWVRNGTELLSSELETQTCTR